MELFKRLLRQLKTSEWFIDKLVRLQPLRPISKCFVEQLLHLEQDLSAANVTSETEMRQWRNKIISVWDNWHTVKDQPYPLQSCMSKQSDEVSLTDTKQCKSLMQNEHSLQRNLLDATPLIRQDDEDMIPVWVLLERILLQLKTPEWVITDLLKLRPMPSADLVAKLTHIEQNIADIPEYYSDVLEDWREIVVILWAKFTELNMLKATKLPHANSSNSLPPTGECSLLTSSIIDKSFQAEHSGSTESSFGELPTWYRQNTNSSNHFNTPSYSNDNFESSIRQINLIKEGIRSSLANVNQIQSIHQTNEMKNILTIMAKAEKAMDPFRRCIQAQTDVVGYCLPKLPFDLVDTFVKSRDDTHHEPHTIRELRVFVQNEMNHYFVERNLKNSVAYREIKSGRANVSTENFCVYCKTVGHNIGECTDLKDMVCYKCFQPGHKAKDCHISNGLDAPPSPSRTICYKCFKTGHKVIDCPLSNGLDRQHSMDYLCMQLKAAFSKCNAIQCSTNIEELKNLLMLVSKARALVMPHWRNISLQKELFSYAFPKLPEDMQNIFLQEYDDPDQRRKCFRDLRSFLQEKIILYHVNLEDGGDTSKFCVYCKRLNHEVTNCTERKSHLCLKCYEFGHKAQRCRNQATIIRVDDLVV